VTILVHLFHTCTPSQERPKPSTFSIYFFDIPSVPPSPQNNIQLEMWANAQRDGHPAEYRWRPLLNSAKSGWRPLLECGAVTPPWHETHWNYLGCPKLTKWSQPLVGRSSPYCEDMWRIYWCLTNLFLIVHTCLSCEDIARQSYAMVSRWRFLVTFLGPAFAASRKKKIETIGRKYIVRILLCRVAIISIVFMLRMSKSSLSVKQTLYSAGSTCVGP